MAQPVAKATEDPIQRGNFSQSLPANLTYIGLRALDPFLQYSILYYGTGTKLITLLGGTVLPSTATAATTGIALLDKLQLSPYRLALLVMSVGSMVKHNIWKLFIGAESVGVGTAAFVGAANAAANAINSYMFLTRAISPAASAGEGPADSTSFPPFQLLIGGVAFTFGIALELLSEVQRKAFKAKAENKGKPCTTGVWSIVRHPNYLGYIVWRAASSLASGGVVWGAFVAGLASWDMATKVIPALDAYCTNRYADMWHDYKKDTPYALLPGVW